MGFIHIFYRKNFSKILLRKSELPNLPLTTLFENVQNSIINQMDDYSGMTGLEPATFDLTGQRTTYCATSPSKVNVYFIMCIAKKN